METNNKELYCVIEIGQYAINFLVGMYYQSTTRILFRQQVLGKFSQHGVVSDKALVAKHLRQLVQRANRALSINLVRATVLLPETHTVICHSSRTLNFSTNHLVVDHDVNTLLTEAKHIPTTHEQRPYFIRPYRYVLDNQYQSVLPPIGKMAHQLELKAIVYATSQSVWNSHLEALQLAGLELLSVLPKGLALGFNLLSRNQSNQNTTVVEWNYDHININAYSGETLYNYKFIPRGINNIITEMTHHLECDEAEVTKYLYNFINLEQTTDSNLILYAKYSHKQQKLIQYTEGQLHQLVQQLIYRELTQLYSELNVLTSGVSGRIIFGGDIITLSGFAALLARSGASLGVYAPVTIGAHQFWYDALLGGIYHQHLHNKIFATLITSVNEVYRNPYARLNPNADLTLPVNIPKDLEVEAQLRSEQSRPQLSTKPSVGAQSPTNSMQAQS